MHQLQPDRLPAPTSSAIPRLPAAPCAGASPSGCASAPGRTARHVNHFACAASRMRSNSFRRPLPRAVVPGHRRSTPGWRRPPRTTRTHPLPVHHRDHSRARQAGRQAATLPHTPHPAHRLALGSLATLGLTNWICTPSGPCSPSVVCMCSPRVPCLSALGLAPRFALGRLLSLGLAPRFALSLLLGFGLASLLLISAWQSAPARNSRDARRSSSPCRPASTAPPAGIRRRVRSRCGCRMFSGVTAELDGFDEPVMAPRRDRSHRNASIADPPAAAQLIRRSNPAQRLNSARTLRHRVQR